MKQNHKENKNKRDEIVNIQVIIVIKKYIVFLIKKTQIDSQNNNCYNLREKNIIASCYTNKLV